MEPNTRRGITDAYARALAALDRAGAGDLDAPLREYFGGAGYEIAREAAAAADAVRTRTFHLEQQLELGFYSDDGSIVGVDVPMVEIVRVLDRDDGTPHVAWSSETWRFVMVLEDGNWRVHQLEIVDVTTAQARSAPIELDGRLRGANTVTVNDVDPTWSGYDPEAGAAELDAVQDLGLDTVRVFLAAPQVGVVDTDALTEFLDAAAARDVAVVPVLFDGRGDHSVDEWRPDHAYLDRVVGALAAHEAIVMWDVKNEPDLDDERSGGAVVVDAWIDRVASRVRAIDPTTPLTVGWSEAAHAHRALDAIDVVSFHHFGDAAELEQGISALTPRVGDRQIVVSEFGRPAWLGFVRGDQPAAQARRVDDLIDVIRGHELAGSIVWVLQDPDRPLEPGIVAGRASASYGLLEADGSRRPVWDVVASDGRDDIAGPGPVERLRSAPLLIMGASAVVVLAVSALWFMRRRRLIET
jgi:hypothetical protein